MPMIILLDLSILICLFKRSLEISAGITLSWFRNNQMKANPDKFQALIVKKGNETIDIELNVAGQIIKPTKCVKLLGLYIDETLSFDDYVSKLCIRAARQTNALRRIAKYLNRDCLIKIYNAFITSNFNYCNVVWHFCGDTNSRKIEKVHKKSLNVVLNDYTSSYSVLLEKVERPTLYVSRIKSISLEVYKCLKKGSPSYITDIFSVSNIPYETRGGTKLTQPKVNTSRKGLNSFRYQGAKIWNELPLSLKNAENVPIFKSKLNDWSGPSCNCGSCLLCNLCRI